MTGHSAPPSGPCAPARHEVDERCAEAERLDQAAVAHRQRLHELRMQLHDLAAQRDADGLVRDRRRLTQAKDAARDAYRRAMVAAVDRAQVQEAARVWLREIDGLNRRLSLADRRADAAARQIAELERSVAGVELAADAARIAAEAAHAACLDARRALAACEEEAQRRLGRHDAPVPQRGASRPISLVLQGDRQTLLELGLRLAEETGVEAGRLQLLLVELREQISARALEAHAVRFPDGHAFWGQIPAESCRRIVESLAALGYRYDGTGGWLDGRAPGARELTIAISNAGLDPLGLRRPSSQDAIDGLWRDTVVVAEEFLAGCAPDLELARVMACLGPRAARLSELWDMWGRLRPLLLAARSA